MSKNSGNKFGQAVKNARTQAHLTQEALAEILNISTTHLKTIESGHRKPSFSLLEKIVVELNISLDALFLSDKTTEDALIVELEHMLKKCTPEQLKMLRYVINGLLQG